MVMAGEIEESFNFNFLADSLHSGSISFGRFESEPLSWERRSSFTHNRYLEEVEKCSKPGSVIEKKAYFEAHFKKKALLHQTSLECQDGTEYRTSDNDISHREEYDHADADNHFSHFDKSPDDSDNYGECDIMDYEREDTAKSYCEPQMESPLNNADVMVDGDLKHDKTVDAHLIESGCDKLQLDCAELKMEVKEILIDETVNKDEVSKATGSFHVRRAAEKDVSSSEHPHHPSVKLRTAMETKLIKSNLKSQINVTQTHRSIPAKVKDSVSKRERQSPCVTKTDEQSLQIVNPTSLSVRRTPAFDDPRTASVMLIHDSKSVKERANNVDEPQPGRTSNRPKLTVKSGKLDTKSTHVIINFKSEERAERRKEFYMKLEEKIHAKEAVMNQIQAIRQEKTEAEIKQFRKSLNFKAIPMPSFYHEAVQPRSYKSKAVSISTNSTRVPSKSSSPGSGATAKSSSLRKTGNNQAVSTNGITSGSLQASSATNCSTAEQYKMSTISKGLSTDRNRPLQAGTKNEVSKKKDRGKEQSMNLQINKVSEGNKAIRDHRVEGKKEKGATRSNNQMSRKDLKGAGIN